MTAPAVTEPKKPQRAKQTVAALLVLDDDGQLRFPEATLPKVEAIVEVAAYVKDRRGIEALLDLVRLAMALEQEAHVEASTALFDVIKRSPPALAALGREAKKDEATHAMFSRFSDGATPRRAPEHDAPAEGVPLRTLLPPTLGRRLEQRRRPKSR